LKSVQQALHRYGERAKSRPSAPASSFAVGPELLQRRIRDELGLDYTLGQVEALAVAEVERVGKMLHAKAARFGHRGPTEELIARWRAEWRPAKPLLELYQTETRR